MKQYLDQSGVEYLWGRIKHNFAKLDSDGRVPASQLPSYVDDVEEYSGLSSFPKEGEAGKIYVAMDSNLTYRWSGSTYVEISPSIALGETSTTAYPGDKGKQLATALQSEISRATTAESDIRSTITAEQNRAQNSEQELNGLIEKNANDITKVSKALDDAASEITASLEAEKQSRIDADNAEKTERQSEDNIIKTDLNTEVSRAKAAEQAETTARGNADDAIKASLNTEVSRAKAEEASLASSIAAETSRATAAESDLSSKIAAEKERAAGAEATITISLNNEISDRKQAVSNETTRATAAEEALDEKIDSIEIVKVDPSDNTTAASYQLHLNGKTKGATIDIAKDQSIKDIEVLDMNATLNGDGTIEAGNPAGSTALCISYILADGSYKLARLDYSKFLEEAEFADGLIVKDHKVYVNIDATSEDFLTVSSNGVKLSGVQDAIDASTASEKAARESADTELKNLINSSKDTLTDALNSEIERAKGAESTITSDLNAEVTRAKAAEGTLQTNINNEAATRKSADDAVNASVTAEVARAKAAEEANATAISTETTNRENADTALQAALDAHKADTSNPHNVTKAQVGLDKVDNTADADKVVASADKLTTSREIWGQEFDGTADVNGDLTMGAKTITEGEVALDYVDLGLPSGTLWARYNIGASSEADSGLYFQWGDTVGYTGSDALEHSYWNTCPGNGGNDDYTESSITAWDAENLEDGVLKTSVDAAYVHSNGRYVMPTSEQFEELLSNTNLIWCSIAGVYGMKCTNTTDDTKYVFFPACGYLDGGDKFYSPNCYWSSENGILVYFRGGDAANPQVAEVAALNSSGITTGTESGYRYEGSCIRGVLSSDAVLDQLSPITITLPSTGGTLALQSDVSAVYEKIDEFAEYAADTYMAKTDAAAGADKLTTSRKIWGQDFDGTNDVNGDLNMGSKLVTEGEAGTPDGYVDLGLPSGTLWAKCNIGADNETDFGLYFQFGDTVGYADDEAKTHSYWNTCPSNGGNSDLDKSSMYSWVKENMLEETVNYYSCNYQLKPQIDAAYVHTRGEAVMPTYQQFVELYNNTTRSSTQIDGVSGIKYTNKNDSSKYIFIPYAGYFSDGSSTGAGTIMRYWSRSIVETALIEYARGFSEDSSSKNYFQYYSFGVRGVFNKTSITLPSSSGTLALTSDVEAETTRATAKEEELQSAIDSKTVKAGRFITVSDDNTIGLDEGTIPATLQTKGCSFNAVGTDNSVNTAYFVLTDAIPALQVLHQTSTGTVTAGVNLSPDGLTIQNESGSAVVVSPEGVSSSNGSIKFTTNPTDSTKNIIKATQDLARISEDGTEGLFVGTTGIGITSKTTKDIVGAQYNTYHVGSDSDTTEYTAVAPLGSDNKIPAQYIDNNLIDLLSYGVEWDVTVADPACTRIGNPLLHKSLPVQSQYKGCVVKNGELQYFLDPNDWSKKADGTASVLDGTDGDVMVRTPKFYGKSGSDGDKRWVRISTIQIDASWVEIPELYVSAYGNTIYTDTDNLTKVASVVNTTANYRGGTNSSSYDTYLDTDPFRTMLGKPRTSISRATMRTYAKNAGQELLCYEFYKWIFYWAYVIEYANFNSQAAFNAELTSDGYHQGGLGAGVTTWNSNSWNGYNSYSSITPCGYGNAIGNYTGTLALDIPETIVGSTTVSAKTLSVPRWRGFDNPFGDIWTNLDGIVIKYNSTSGYNDVYTTTDASKFGDDASVMSVAGQEITTGGYIKEFSLGETGEIIPFTVGGSESTYKCDYCYTNQASGNTLLVGGLAHYGGRAGLGAFDSLSGVGRAYSNVGFRSVIRA